MSENIPSTLTMYRRLAKLSPSGWLFSRTVSLRAPYFASIRPLVIRLEPGLCVAEIEHRRRVQNHIGTVHAIALCNLAELSAGLVCEASLPTSMRWIPKRMSVDYLAKAKGRMRAEARPAIAAVHAEEGYELPITVSVRDPGGTEALRADIRMWATPKPRR
jgi:acyl-coenzyme A thioesterase PaaI-like protein